jgi:hypothetical protein
LDDFTTPYDVCSGFESVESHMEFAKTKGVGKYREIVGSVERI